MEAQKKITAYITPSYNDYKNFFKYYYDRRYKTMRIILTVIAAGAALCAVYLFIMKNQTAALVLLWVAAMLYIYPRNAYRSQARKMKKTPSAASNLTFTAESVSENRSGQKKTYIYSELYDVWESAGYFYIFCSEENALIVPKDRFRDDAERDTVRAWLGLDGGKSNA